MLKVAQIDYIKFLREEEGLSISEIERQLGINWRTAKKYADSPVSTQKLPRRKRNSPVMGPYEIVVDLWLEEDVLNPRKQKLTARKIFKELKKIGFNGSERTVREYVKNRRKEIHTTWKKIYVRLEHDPGLAQADFGEFKALEGKTGKVKKYCYLILSFPYSNTAFSLALPSENTECFLYGLQKLFEQAGGAPREIWFDNLPPAVAEILSNKERKLTSVFAEFQWYYRFKCKFCNTGAGNEKGHVENKVSYIRRNYFSPMPVINDLNQFNEDLRKELEEDRERLHYTKQEMISELWEIDQGKLLPLPNEKMDIASTAMKRVNKYGEIRLKEESHPYPVPDAKPEQNIFIKIYWDKLKFYDESGEKFFGQTPRIYMQTTENMDWLTLIKIYRNKPRAIENGLYLKALPENIKHFLLADQLSERRKRIKCLIELLEEQSSIEKIDAAIEQAQTYGRTDYGSIKNILSYQKINENRPLKPKFDVDASITWQPDLDQYNGLLGDVGSDG